MKRKGSPRSDSRLTDEGIFVFLTLVIFFVAIGVPTLVNTSPTFGYDQNTIQRLTPVTSYYQQAFAEQEMMSIIGNYYYNPLVLSAYLVLPTTVDLPPPDTLQYFIRKYNQVTELDQGFILFDKFEKLKTSKNSEEITKQELKTDNNKVKNTNLNQEISKFFNSLIIINQKEV